MAKYGSSLAEVKVYIDGKEQAKKDIEELKATAKKFSDQMELANEQMLKASEQLAEARERANKYSGDKESAEYKAAVDDELKAQTAYDNAQKSFEVNQTEHRKYQRLIKESEKLTVDLEQAMARLSDQDIKHLRLLQRQLDAIRSNIDPKEDKDGTFLAYVNNAIKTVADTIKNRKGELVEFEDIMADIMNVDSRTLDGVIKRLKDLLATTDKFDSEKIEKYTSQLAFAEEAKRQRTLRDGRKIMSKVESGKYEASIDVTQADLKTLEEYKRLLKTSDTKGLDRVNSVMDQLKQNIKETEAGFMSFEKAMENAQGIMSGAFDPTLDDLEQIQKVLKEGMQNKFHIANPEDEAQLKQTLGLMEEMLKKQKEVMRLNHQDKVNAVSGNLDKVSPVEIEEAVKAAKELQQVAKTKEEFIQLGEFIGKAEARLKDWNETSKQSVMKSQIKDLSAIRALSDGALQDQLKFWEGTMNAAKKTSTVYKEAKKNFEDLQAESKRRLQFEGEKTISDVKLGVGDGSTKQMQERLKLLQDYRAIINGTKPDAYKAVDEAILKLTEDIKASQAGFLSFDKALERAKQISEGTFKPTLEDLEQVQKVLKEGMQNKFNLVDDADIDQLKETRRLMDEMAKKQAEADRIRLKDQATEIMGGDYTKTIEGTKQAIELLKKYQDTLDTTNPDAINEVTKSINKMKEELESASRAKAEEVMADPMKFSADEINEAIKLTEKLQSATNNATVWENYEQQLIKAREARDRFADDSKYKAMVKQFEDLEDLTANAWAEQKKYWEAMRDSGKHYDEAIAKLKEMQELETTRMKDSSTKTLTTDLLTAGTGDIKQSVEWLTKYQASLEPLEDEWTNINNLIKAGEERLKSITETVSKQNLSEQAGKIMGGDYTKTIEGTKQAIEILKKYQQTLDATDTKGINKVEESIKKMRDELDTVTKKNARETLTTNLKVAGTEDIKQAVEWLTKYQGTLKPLSPLWKKINKEIEAGNERLKELSDGKKMAAMTEQFKKYKDLSVNALTEQKKYWTEVKNTHAETDKEYKRAVARLEKIDELEKSRTKAEATPLITEATSGTWDKTIEETEKAIKLIQEYKKQLHTSTDAAAITDADKAIEALNANLKKGKEGLMDFGDAIAKAKTIAGGGFSGTLEDLEKLQKAIKEGINTKLDITSDADIDRLKEAQKLLEDIAKEQQKAARARLEEQAKDIQTQVKGGTYKGTIEETEKAIELQRQYMKLLDTTDADGIKEVEDTIEALQQKLKQAKNELMSYKDAMKEVDKMNKGTWKGTLEELEKIKKSLEYYKKNKLEVGGDTKELKDIEKALREIEKTGRGAHMSMADIEKLLKHLDSASVEQLTNAAKELQDQLQDAVRGTQEYAETAAKLREVNLELKKAKKEWEGQENVIVRTAKRLAAYVAVYGGFNEIMGKMKEMVNMNLQLSDSMADVQKTTGLTGVELQELGRSLERIDTRTTTAELYQLAAAAGQIGLKTQEDVLGFAKAANTISVALNELGAEGSASLMKIATLTGEVERYGTEQALTRVGSAINELTANSAATAGPIADFISRVGGIASASKMAIHEMAALGAATDASAQSIEIAGTSMNKFITALVSNTENIAYATNLNAQELQSLINEGNTMQAVVRVLESMQTMDRGGISVAMKELGSEGARMNQYIASMVSNLDMLKAQLTLSKEAFEENVSVLNEYNVKQESALGILQRMKNSFMDTFVNSKMTVVLKDILQTIASIPHWLEQHRTILFGVRVMIASIIAFKIPFLLNALMKNLWGLYGLLSGPMINALTSFRAAWKKARFEIYMAERAMGASVAAATVATRGFIGFARVLAAFVSANWLGIILAGVGLVTAAIYHFTEETDKVAKATSELTQKHTRQIEELNALRAALDATNTSYAVKAAAMKEINSLYSKYLGFELSELDNYEKKKAALDYINAKLKENQTLELATRQKEVYTEEFNKDSEKSLEGVTEALMSIPEIGANRLTEAMSVMHKAISEGATSTEEVMERLSEHFKTTVEFDGDEYFPEMFKFGNAAAEIVNYLVDTDLEHLENYIEKYSTLQQQLSGTDEYFNGQKLENQRISDEALEELAIAHQRRIETLEELHQEKLAELKRIGGKLSEAEQVAHLKEMLREQEQYQKTAEQMLQRAREEDENFLANAFNEEELLDSEAIVDRFRGVYDDKKLGELISSLNEAKTRIKEIKAEMAKSDEELDKANAKLLSEQQKKNNEAQIAEAQQAVDARKKINHDLYKDLLAEERKWSGLFGELQQKATSEARQTWNQATEDIKRNIRSLQVQIEGDPWGKAYDLKDWKQFPELIEGLEGASVTSLVQGFEKLRDNTKLITQDVDAFNKMFDLKTPLKDLKEVNTQVFRWLAQIRAELKRRDRNTSGSPIFTNAKEELDHVMKTLQTHFLKRQAEIRKAYVDGTITSKEMDRRLSENDRVFVNERIELRKMLLGENSNFLKELYPALEKTDLTKLRLDIQVVEDGITDDLRKSLEEDVNLVQENAIKIRQAIEKELLAADPFETLRQNFRESLDALMLMSSEFERKQSGGISIPGLDEQGQQERLDFLIELSRKSYTVDKDGLRQMFESHEEYYDWVKNLDDKQMQVLLAKLQWFYDESLLKHKAYADRLEKALESRYEQEGLKYDDVAKIEWEIEQLEDAREKLAQERDNSISKAVSEDEVRDAYKVYEEELTSINQLINRKEEELLDAREKAENKRKSRQSKKEREAKEEMEASISALKAYYKEQEAVIRQNALENKWTPEDLERKLTENKIKAETDAIELRKRLLGEPSTFDPFANEGYKGAITGTIFFGNTRDLDQQAKEIKVWGKGFRDGMRNEIAESNVEIAKEMQKVSDVIKNALLEGDMFGKFKHDFATMLDELGILTSDLEDELFKSTSESMKKTGMNIDVGLTEEDRAKRIEALTQFADQSYQINEEGLRDLMAKNTQFALWANNLSDEEMTLLLGKLRNYYDDRIELTRKYQDKLAKEFESYYQQTGKQADYEADKQEIDKRKERRDQLEGYGVTRGIDYEGKRKDIADEYQNESEVLADKASFLNERLNTLQKGSAEYLATQKLITDTELAQNQLLADSQKALTQVYMDEWTKRAERWGQWGEMFGEYLGEQVMLEKQANDARARGDLETAKKIEQQQKQNKQALIQNLLSKIVDEAALWAKEYALKMMFNSLMLAEDKRKAIEEATLQGKSSMLSILLNALTGQSKEHAKGIPGLVTGAIIFAATMALQAFAKSAIANMFPEAATESTGTRKLSTGMLTYAEGNYPVLGNDGKVYDAKYEGAGMKTGVYGGGAHFGIFSEKQPEMIVDGKTTQKIILNYPYIYDAITTIAKNGRLKNAMPTFATGDYPAGMKQLVPIAEVDASAGSNEQMERMSAALEQTQAVNNQLLKLLQNGITAHLDGLETHKQQKKNERFLKRRGID